MKTNTISLLAAVTVLTASVVFAANNPVWTATMPVPSFVSGASSISSIVSNSAGSTLAVLNHYDASMWFGSGTQLVLIGAHGQLLATGEYAAASSMNPTVIPLSVTPRRIVMLVAMPGQPFRVDQGVVDSNKHLVFSPLPYSSGTETIMTPPYPLNGFTSKTLFTTTSASGKIVEIRRYSVAKMKPSSSPP